MKFVLLCMCFLQIYKLCDSQVTNIINRLQRVLDTGYCNNKLILKKRYDFIIIGAGSAGAVVANRLSENKDWSVLLIEAGNDENFFTEVPLMAAFQSATRYNWGYKSEKSNFFCLSLKKGRCNVPRGKALGGTSVINLLIYHRGNKLDYEEWKIDGNSQWGYNDVLPYFIKSENCSNAVECEEEFHGRNGYLNVEHSPFQTPLLNNFIKAGIEFGYRNCDPNGPINLCFSKVQATMQTGRRLSTSKAFLVPIINRPNLQILTDATVTRILIDEKKQAVGVTLLKHKCKYKIKAKKEVILSAGALNSPQLLMLSGIGPQEELEHFNISVIQNLKVGYNLQDHVSYVHSFLINSTVSVSDLSVQNPIDIIDYVFNHKGPFTIPGGAEALAFVKTRLSPNKVDDYPDIEFVLGAGGFNNDFYGSLRNLFGISNKLFYELYSAVLFTPSFSITTVLLKPRSKGRVTIKSSNPLQPPSIHLNYFSDESDIKVMVEGLRMVCMLTVCLVILNEVGQFEFLVALLING